MINNMITDNLSTLARTVQKRNATGRGNSKKIDLYGIKKLRELILELAVRGKLVPQNPDDEPASLLLERIAEERDRLVKEKKIKKPKKLPEIGEDEKPFELPEGWKFIRLGNTGNWATGNGFPKKEQGLENLDTLFCKVSDMNLVGNEKFILSTSNTVSSDTALRLRLNLHQKGTVIFPKIGGAIATNKRRLICRPTAIDNNCLGISPNTGVSPEYLFLLLTSIDMTKYQAGTSVPALSQSTIELITIGLPPEAEQHRIVSKVDELMNLCDQIEQQTEASLSAHATLVENLLSTLTNSANAEELEQNWQRIAEHFTTLFTTEESIDQLKQTILQLAVMGKLVPQDPNDEPAAKLLERIAAEKAQLIKDKKIKKQKALPPITEEEKPFALPEGWEWCRLAELVTIRGGKRVSNGYKLLKEPTPYIYIRVADMKNGTIDDSDLHYIDEEMRGKISQYIITKDDIYMTIVGATIGKCGLVPDKFDQMNLTENAARLMPSSELSKSFLHKCLESCFCQNQFINKTKQVGVQKMALSRLASTLIPLPPKKTALSIDHKINELISLCEQAKTHLQKQQQTRIHLTDAMVESALA